MTDVKATETTVNGNPVPTSYAARANWLLPLVLVLGVALGIGIGVFLPRFDNPGDDSPEAGFARDMTTHHAQAVELGMITYGRSTNENVRSMARDIALNQAGQIGMMQAWLQQWGLSPNGSQPAMAWMPEGSAAVVNGLMPGMATPAQLAQLRAATGKDEDRLFLQLMIQHHLGGIHMSQEIVDLSTNKQVTTLAQTAINGQQRELTDMRSLQASVGTGP